MPYFNGTVRNLQLSMYVLQTQTKYQLQVGVMSNLNDANTFVPVATINNSSTSAQVLHTVSFSSYSGSGHYIAFRNILAAGNSGDFSCNYIDDITLSNTTTYTITATANPAAGGTVTGGGTFTSGSTCTLRAHIHQRQYLHTACHSKRQLHLYQLDQWKHCSFYERHLLLHRYIQQDY